MNLLGTRSIRSLFTTWHTKLVLAMYLVSVAWWVTIATRGLVETTENYLFGIPFVLIPFFGAVTAILRVRSVESQPLRRSVTLISFGLLAWGSSSIVYMYYNLVLGVPAPYPSLADFGYIAALPLEFSGLLYLVIFLGYRKQLVTIAKQVGFFLVPFGLLLATYYVVFATKLQLGGAAYQPTLTIDFIGLVPDVINLAVVLLALYAVVLDKRTGRNFAVVLLAGYILHYIADLCYYHTNAADTFYIGNWVDLIYITAISLKVAGLHSMFVQLRIRDK